MLRGVVVVKKNPDRNTFHDNHDHKNNSQELKIENLNESSKQEA